MSNPRGPLPQNRPAGVQRNRRLYYRNSRDAQADVVLAEARERGARILLDPMSETNPSPLRSLRGEPVQPPFTPPAPWYNQPPAPPRFLTPQNETPSSSRSSQSRRSSRSSRLSRSNRSSRSTGIREDGQTSIRSFFSQQLRITSPPVIISSSSSRSASLLEESALLGFPSTASPGSSSSAYRSRSSNGASLRTAENEVRSSQPATIDPALPHSSPAPIVPPEPVAHIEYPPLFPGYHRLAAVEDLRGTLESVWSFHCQDNHAQAPAPPAGEQTTTLEGLTQAIRRTRPDQLSLASPLDSPRILTQADFVNMDMSFDEMLSDSTLPVLSIPATEEAIRDATAEVGIRRSYDIDSVIFRPTSLRAFRGLNLRLSYLPPYNSSITQNPHCRVAGVQPHRCYNLQLASVNAHNRSQIHILFPHAGTPAKQQTYLSHSDQARFVDHCVNPALQVALPLEIYQQHPHDFAAARARASGLTDATRARTVRYTHLNFALPSPYLGAFWDALRTNCNEEASRKFRDPFLLYQIHGIKDWTAAESPMAALNLFRQTYLQGMDMTHIDPDAFWVDVGFRDVPSPFPGAAPLSRPWTLLYKPPCLERITTPSLQAAKYVQYGIRDFGCIDLFNDSKKHHGDRPAVAQIKGYNSHKELFATPAKNSSPFRQHKLALIVLDEQVQKDWYNQTNQTSAAPGYRGAEALRESYRQQKAQVWDMLREPAGGHASFGVRRECRVLFACLSHLDLDTVAPTGVVRPYQGVEAPSHHPFWLVPTADLNACVLAQVSSYALALERLIALTAPGAGGSLHAASPDDQVHNTVMAQLLQTLLVLTCTSGKPELYPWIFRSTRRVKLKRGSPPIHIRGLGVYDCLTQFGYIRLPFSDFQWETPCLPARVCKDIHPPQAFHSQFSPPGARRVPVRLLQTRATWLDSIHLRDMRARFLDAVAAEDASAPPPVDAYLWTKAQRIRNSIFQVMLESAVYEFNKAFLHELKTYVAKIKGLDTSTTAFRLVYPTGSECEQARQVITIRYLDNLFLRIYTTLGPHRCLAMFSPHASIDRLKLPLPKVGQYRGDRPILQSWNGWLTYILRGRDFENDCVWKTKAFAQRMAHLEQQWARFCQQSPYPSVQGQAPLFTAFVHRFVGRYIGVTPNCQAGKFIQVSYTKVNRQEGDLPKLCAASFFVPAIRISHCPETQTSFKTIDLDARWAQISEDTPPWLYRALRAAFERTETPTTTPPVIPSVTYTSFVIAMGPEGKLGRGLVLPPGRNHAGPPFDPSPVRSHSLIHKLGNTAVPGLYAVPNENPIEDRAIQSIIDHWAEDPEMDGLLGNHRFGMYARLNVLDDLFTTFAEEQEANEVLEEEAETEVLEDSDEEVEELDVEGNYTEDDTDSI